MMLPTIAYKQDNIAYFPLLSHVKHGFTWGKGSQNMATVYGNTDDVHSRINQVFSALHMHSLQHAIYMMPEHSDRIIDITPELTVQRAIDGDCFFTTLSGIPLYVCPADCTVSVMYATSNTGEKVIGLLHAGRNGLDLKLPLKAIEHLQKTYGVTVKDMYIGITPSIAKMHYNIDKNTVLPNLSSWKNYAQYIDDMIYLDLLGYLIQQYHDMGIDRSHIQAYAIDTYTAAQQNESFSHRYATQNHISQARMLVVIEK